jgi:myosin heavy chain 9/10/11/14
MGVNAPRPNTSRRIESRVAELTNQLNQASNEKAESSRMHRVADKTARDVKFDLQESERIRQRLEQQVGQLEGKVADLRAQCNQLVSP